MSDYYVVLVYLVIMCIGLTTPFAFCLGYVWVDLSYPQFMSKLLTGMPVAMVMGALAIVTYALFDRRSPPRLTFTWLLIFVMALWVTATTTWAVSPVDAWSKWNWAFKSVLFSALVPLMIRSRVQIEGYLQTILFSAAIAIIPFGAKGILSGGGYAKNLSLLPPNIGLGEGSTLSLAAMAFIPFALHLSRHSLFFSSRKVRMPLYYGYALACLAAAIATAARTAIVAAAVLAATMWWKSRHKIRLALALVIFSFGVYHAAPDRWKHRMASVEAIDNSELKLDASMAGRLAVWEWTLQFIRQHPLGGGFNAYVVNHVVKDGRDYGKGKAFHSIYFEVLGEHGYVGLAIYLLILLGSVMRMLKTMRSTRHRPEFDWNHDLAKATLTALLVVMSAGAFVGIAFQPLVWYIIALGMCLQQHVPMPLRGLSPQPRQMVISPSSVVVQPSINAHTRLT